MRSPSISPSQKLDYDDVIVRSSSTFRPVTFESHVGAVENTEHAVTLEKEWTVELNEGLPSITVKSITAGILIGAFTNFLALYYSLRTGIVPSLNILSGLGGFLLVKVLLKLKIFKGIFTIQENAVVQTTAVACLSVASSSSGYASGYLAMSYAAYESMGGNSFPGNRIQDTFQLTWTRNLLWSLSLAFFGFFLAFPLRNHVILKKKLPFPSGTVTAYVIKSMHSKSAKTAKYFATISKWFAISFCGQLVTWIFDGIDNFPIFGVNASNLYQWNLDFDLGEFGIGAILSPKINASMIFGAVVTYGILQPYIATYRNGKGLDKWLDLKSIPEGSDVLGLNSYAIFSGLAIMVVTGAYTIIMLLCTLCADYHRSKARRALYSKDDPNDTAAANKTFNDAEETQQMQVLTELFRASTIPSWIPYLGYVVFSAFTIILLHVEFGVHWYQTLIATLVVPIFAVSNIEGVGQTDWDVSASYGKMMMFPFGAWNFGQSILPSLALCTVTISGCSNAACLLQDFKTGYLVGASPNAMFIAQMIGALVGAFFTPCVFALLSATFTIPNSNPGAFLEGRYGTIYRTLAVVATGSGFDALPKNVLWIAFGFMIFAILCLLLETFLPPKYSKFVPDASGLSIGILVQPACTMEICIGGLVSMWWTYWCPSQKEKVPYIASGCVAGSGVAVIIRCLLSILSIEPPIKISYADTQMTLNIVQWFMCFLCFLIFLSVLLCGAWFLHQGNETFDEQILDVTTENAGETCAEPSSFRISEASLSFAKERVA